LDFSCFISEMDVSIADFDYSLINGGNSHSPPPCEWWTLSLWPTHPTGSCSTERHTNQTVAWHTGTWTGRVVDRSRDAAGGGRRPSQIEPDPAAGWPDRPLPTPSRRSFTHLSIDPAGAASPSSTAAQALALASRGDRNQMAAGGVASPDPAAPPPPSPGSLLWGQAVTPHDRVCLALPTLPNPRLGVRLTPRNS
jgi:hypothetical protein